VTAARDLTGLVGSGAVSPPERTVTAPPPRRRTAERGKAPADPIVATVAPSRTAATPESEVSVPTARRSRPQRDKPPGIRQDDDMPTTATVRISVNIPVGCKQWLARQAREQQRFVSEVVMEALDRHGDDASPPSGRAKRVAVPDGTICNIVLPIPDRQRLDDIVARRETTRSALLSDILLHASRA
jgi:hypothetical protein